MTGGTAIIVIKKDDGQIQYIRHTKWRLGISGNVGMVNYAYNIRNWLNETKSDRFSQNLWYETTGAYPCFNGNISRLQWQSGKDHVLRGYDFAYDGLNRLEKSTYAEGTEKQDKVFATWDKVYMKENM